MVDEGRVRRELREEKCRDGRCANPSAGPRQHDAQVVGNPRTPSLVFDFADEALRWSRFSAAFDDIGSAEIIAILTPPGLRHAS